MTAATSSEGQVAAAAAITATTTAARPSGEAAAPVFTIVKESVLHDRYVTVLNRVVQFPPRDARQVRAAQRGRRPASLKLQKDPTKRLLDRLEAW